MVLLHVLSAASSPEIPASPGPLESRVSRNQLSGCAARVREQSLVILKQVEFTRRDRASTLFDNVQKVKTGPVTKISTLIYGERN